MSFRGRSFRPLGGSRPLGRPPPVRQMPEYLPGQRLRPPVLPQVGRPLPQTHDNYVMRAPPSAFAERDYRMHERLDRSRSPQSEYQNNSRRPELDSTDQHYDEGRNAYSDRRRNSPVNYEQRASPVGHRDRHSVADHSHKSSDRRHSSEKDRKKTHSPAINVDRSASAVEKAKEMAARTREIISKLGGLKQLAVTSNTAPVADAQLITTVAEEPKLPESSPAVKLNAPESSTISRLLQNDTLVKYAFNLQISSDLDVVKAPVKKPEASMSFSAVSAVEHENQYVYETEKIASKVMKSEHGNLSGYLESELDDKAAFREETSFSYKPETVVRTSVPKVEFETMPALYGYKSQDEASFGSGVGGVTGSSEPKVAVESKPSQFGYKEDMFSYPVHDVVTKVAEPIVPQATESQPKEDADAFATGYDPTIANILKSIGFNFELSSLMQEKARNEKAQSEAPGFGSAVGAESSYPYAVGQSMMSPTESIQTPVVYEQMAHRYREEQLRQFGEPQTLAAATVNEDIHHEAASDLKLKYKLAEAKPGKKGGALYEDFSDSEDDFASTVESAAAAAPVMATDTLPAAAPATEQMLFPVASEMMQSAAVNKTANDLDWEQSTQEFIRKLQQPRQTPGRTVTIIPRVEASPPAPAAAPTVSDNTIPVGQTDHVKMMRTFVPLEELRTIRKTIIINDKGQNSAASSKPDVDVTTVTDIRKSIKVERKKTPPTVTPQKLSLEENQSKQKESKEKETAKAAKESDARQSAVKMPAGKTTTPSSNNSSANVVENKASSERQKKIENLLKELENLRRQQNALMRRKKREKDGHKDPIIVENSKLQEEINKQINLLKRLGQQTAGISQTSNKTNVDEKPTAATVSEIPDDKSVAKMSVSPSPERRVSKSPGHRSTSTDRKANRRATKSAERKVVKSPDRRQRRSRSHHSSSSSSERKKSPGMQRRRSPIRRDLRSHSPEYDDIVVQVGSRTVAGLRDTRRYRSNRGENDERRNKTQTTARPKRAAMKYEYFDGGNHFCRCCNFISRNVFEHCQHLSSSLHQQNVDPFDKPWLKAAANKEQQKQSSPSTKIGVVAARIKGVEFLMATEAFYCSLCNEFMGSSTCAENHLKSETHNEKYNKYLDDNTFYERRLELEKSASSAMMPKGSSLNRLSESQESGGSAIQNELSAVVEAAKLRAKRLVANTMIAMDDEPPQPPLKKSRVVPKSHVREDILTLLDSPASAADSADASDSRKSVASHDNSDTVDGKQKMEPSSDPNKSQHANSSVAPSKKAALPFIGKLPKFKLSRNARVSADQNADDKSKSGTNTGSTTVEERIRTRAAKGRHQLSITEVIDMDVDDDSSKSLDAFLTISDESGIGHVVPVVGTSTVGPPTLSTYLLQQQDSSSVPTQLLMTSDRSCVTVCSGAASVTTASASTTLTSSLVGSHAQMPTCCTVMSAPCSLPAASVTSSTASTDGSANSKASCANTSLHDASNLLTVDGGGASVTSSCSANVVQKLTASDIVTKLSELVTESSSRVVSSPSLAVNTNGSDVQPASTTLPINTATQLVPAATDSSVQRPTSVDAGSVKTPTGSSKSTEVSLPATSTQTMEVAASTDDTSNTQDYEPKSQELGDKVTPVDTATSNLLPSFTAKLTSLVMKESAKVNMGFGDDFEILDECDAGDG